MTDGKKRKKRSISRELTISLFLLIALIQGGLVFLVYQQQSRQMLKDLETTADSYAVNLGEILGVPIWNFNEDQIEKIGTGYVKNEVINEVKISDTQGNSLFHQKKESGAEEQITRTVKIRYKEQMVGEVLILLSLKPYRNQLKMHRNQIFFILVVSISAIFITTGFLLRIFMRKPIRTLQDSIDRIAEGDYSHGFDKVQHAELAGIGNRFREMVDKVKAREKSLMGEVEERLKVEASLRASEEKHRNILENMEEGYFEVDLKGNLTFFNEAICRISGFSKEELLDMNYRDFLPEESAEILSRRFGQAYESGSPTALTNFKILTKDGSVHFVETSMNQVDGQEGVRGIRGIVRDITDRIVAEKEKIRLERQFQQAQKMEAIGTLAGGIAHDFNNILSAVIGYTELVLHDEATGMSLKSNLKKVLKAGHRAKGLVNQILTFSRQGELEKEPLQVRLVINEALKLLRATLPSSIEIKTDLQSDSLVVADPTQIHQVIMNLCANAGHAMQDSEGVLFVGLKDVTLDSDFTRHHPEISPGTFVRLTVRDNGKGIPSEILDRVFDPFFTTKKKGEGTGMGLSVVHGIITSHSGAILVSSQIAGGTVFDIYLPVTEVGELPRQKAERPIDTGKERILFVDDEEFQADIGKQMLERLGYRVTTMTNSREALALFQKSPEAFDIVISDMTMPSMTGDLLAKALFEIRPDLPIIICTGYSERMTAEDARSMGIRGYALKPIVMKDIARLIRSVLDEASG